MKIEDLYIEGFGPFASKQVGPFTGSITVIHGANEAGKSTLLEFIRMVLFGFPRQNSNTHYPPLVGGRHGGRLSIVDDAGHRYSVERFRGAKGGPVSIMTGDGAPVDEANLSRLLGGASEDVFKNVFAFSLDELQAGKSLRGADVDSQIYSAGLGAARLPQFLTAISRDKDKIFKKTKGKTIVGDLLTQLEGVTEKLNQVEGNAAEYGRMVTRQADIELELETATADRSRLEQQSAENQRLLKGWEDWVSFVGVEEKLTTLPQFDEFPEEAIARLNRAEEREVDERLACEGLALRLENAETSAQAEIGDESLLQHRAAIEDIRRGRNRFDDSARDLPERRTELQSLENSLGQRLRDIGSDWDEERLESFDTSIVTRDHIEQARETLAGKVVEVQQRTGQLDQAKVDLSELGEVEKQARNNAEEKDKPDLNGAALEQKRSALRTTRTRFGEFARLRLRHSDLRDQMDSSTSRTSVKGQSRWIQGRGLPLLLGFAAVILIAASATLGQQSFIFGGIAGALLLITAVYIYFNSGREASGGAPSADQALLNNVTKAALEESDARQILLEAATELGLDSLPDAVVLDDVESELGAFDVGLRAWESIQQRLTETVEARQQQERRAENATQAQAKVQQGLEAARTDWQTWLTDRNLAKTLTPETMIDFLGRVDTAHVALGEIRNMRLRVKAIQFDITEYRESVAPLADTFGLPIGTEEPSELASAADVLIERYHVAHELANRRDIAREESEMIGQQLRQREERLKQNQEVLVQLLGAGGAGDPEDFRHRAAQHTERRELERTRGELLLRLRRLSGAGEEFDRFKEKLASGSLQTFQDRTRELAEQIAITEGVRNALLGEQGEIRTLLSQLTSEEESSVLRVRENVLIEELREQAREWSQLIIEEELLTQTRRKCEEERQPYVIQHGQNFFSAITDNRYHRLYSQIGEQTVTVVDRTGVSKRPEELSRGTREQLYLSLRFGLIREFGERTERLPVVVDEVLVNFDPKRAGRAARAFVELGKTNQVLVFTCHPETVALFTDVAPETQVIQIDPTE